MNSNLLAIVHIERLTNEVLHSADTYNMKFGIIGRRQHSYRQQSYYQHER